MDNKMKTARSMEACMNHSSFFAALLWFVSLSWTPAAQPESTKTPTKAGAPQAQYQALVDDYEKARKDFFDAYGKASEQERQKLVYPQPEKFSDRFMTLATEHPNDPAALDALVWVATNCRNQKEQEPALHLLERNHLKNPKLADVPMSLIYSESAKVEEFLRALLKESPHHAVKGNAAYSLAFYLNRKNRNPKEVEKIFEEVVAHYSDVKGYRTSLADMATSQLFEIRNLKIGQEAPDVTGETVDGKELKLSSYRGKVVVIDFWGDW